MKKKHTFRDLKDSKSFNISLLAGLFVVFLIAALDILECTFTKVILIGYDCGLILWWRLFVFVVLFILVWVQIKQYISLADIQEEIDAARKRKK